MSAGTLNNRNKYASRFRRVPERAGCAAARGHHHWRCAMVSLLRRRRAYGLSCSRRPFLPGCRYFWHRRSSCGVVGVCFVGSRCYRTVASSEAGTHPNHGGLPGARPYHCSAANVLALQVNAVSPVELACLHSLWRGPSPRPHSSLVSPMSTHAPNMAFERDAPKAARP